MFKFSNAKNFVIFGQIWSSKMIKFGIFLYVRYVLINKFVLILLPKNLEKLGERI